MHDASFPMLTRPMATSSERIALSRLFDSSDLSVMVETQGDRGVPVLDKGCVEDYERW